MPLSRVAWWITPIRNSLPLVVAEFLVTNQYVVLALSVVLAGALKMTTVSVGVAIGVVIVATRAPGLPPVSP